MNKKKYIIIGIVTIILISALLINFMGTEPEKMILQKTDAIEAIAASGRVEAANRIDMTYQKSGTVDEIMVTEGQSLLKGQRLLSLEHKEEDNAVQSAKLQLRSAQSDFSDVSRQLEIAKAQYDAVKAKKENTSLLLERNLALYEIGGVSRTDIEEIELRLAEISSQELLAQLEYRSLLPNGLARQRAQIGVENAVNEVEKAEFEKDKKILYAPFDGIVLEISDNEFSNVMAGQTAIVFAEEESFIIADIDERDYQKVRVGQNVFIQLINSNQTIEGEVRGVSPKIDRTRGTVRVKIDLKENKVLTTDTGVNIEIIVNEFEGQYIIPTQFLFEDPSRIIINENDRAKVVEISEYRNLGETYLIESPDLGEFEGLEIVAIDAEDGDRIR